MKTNYNRLSVRKTLIGVLALASMLVCLNPCSAATITRKSPAEVDFLQLNRGNALSRSLLADLQPEGKEVDRLLTPDRKLVVQTSLAQVQMEAESAVLIREDRLGETVGIYNLHDTASGAVKIICGEDTLSLSPGNTLVITSRTGYSFSALNPSPDFGYRNVQELKARNELRAFKAEFSIVSAISELRSIGKIDKLSKSVIKTAAIQTLLKARYGQFKRSTI